MNASARDLPASALVAYLSAEFGVTERLPVYSGGLGVLAGDHLKAASDLGVPLVGVGLFYRHGYFRQRLTPDGEQVAWYPRNEPAELPLEAACGADGAPVEVVVRLRDEDVRLRVWRHEVGSVPLLLLDADVEGNTEEARHITDALYGGDRETRIRQEILLGVGALRALRALGMDPSVIHMNEGHSAFVQVERLREMVVGEGLDVETALERLPRGVVFTTHTPVPAGNEVFATDLLREYLVDALDEVGLPFARFRELGVIDPQETGFGMTPFALRTSGAANGVAQLHGEVSRRMWAGIWPDLPVDEVPIGAVTNGVHAPTWVGPDVAAELGARGVDIAGGPDAGGWDAAAGIPDEVLWRVRRAARGRLFDALPERLAGTGADPSDLAAAAGLDPDALTIGFARRFATYKRAGLIFSDLPRLARLVNAADRPVQILFAGKAHPADEGGKALLAQVVAATRTSDLRARLLFIPDYDTALAALLVAGVDVWLNTPRRPQEASGTSGMKAALNGALNLSISDGWWPEAAPGTGWTIGDPSWTEEGDVRDAKDAESLYRLLEEEVVPLFHRRDADGLPREWLAMSRAAIVGAGRRFTTARMVGDYVREYYLPAHTATAATRLSQGARA
ncbi:MAG TPA: alpha-glucan family phosphorylase [Miltoncostaeaceae bacterium]|nr:alpha-glucan family phosphorylase [Miltoncostaeaceae bacterium]